ncbi:ABC transporter permease [Zhihengliuella halotolerans]|uniref:ABC transporter permease n=1 Tax=Zhihengliuella halotolerans TaxID=370736 RepID=UPI000C7F9E38|nr:ABC transporter permease [Zhihengliuella halotolerans]
MNNDVRDAAHGPILVDVTGMEVRGGRLAFVDYWLRVWDARSYMFHEARSKVDDAGKRLYLGNLWLIINPILDGAIYFLVFGVILNLDKGIENFLAFLLIGVFFFKLTSRSVSASAASIMNRRRKASGAALPALAEPLTVNVRTWLTGFPSYLVMLVMIFVISPPKEISLIALLVIPIIVLQVLVTAGVSVLAAHFVGIIPDLQNVLQVATRAWMFGSGVMFSAERFLGIHPIIDFLVHWNPMHWVLEYSRSALIYNEVPTGDGWYVIALWALVPLIIGSWLIWLRGDKYATTGR